MESLTNFSDLCRIKAPFGDFARIILLRITTRVTGLRWNVNIFKTFANLNRKKEKSAICLGKMF